MTDATPVGRRVAVIGGGVAGLVTARVLKHDGFDVTVFEQEREIGGVWATSRAYPGLRTNNPRETYAFSDFPYPPGTRDFPTAAEVRAYLQAYVEHFGLRSRLQLATEVISVSRGGPVTNGPPPGFRVTVRHARDPGGLETRQFDFVVVCNGVFSRPYLPRFEGQERFRGAVLHSSQLTDPAVLRGQRVMVVGAGKSALDCASFAGREAASCVLVCRHPHWMLPRYFFGRIRVDRILFTRWAEMLLPAYHRAGRGERAARRIAAPLLWLWWRFQGWLVARLAGMPADMVPDRPLPGGIENIGIGDEPYRTLRQGLVQTRRAGIASFVGGDRVCLDTGEVIAADVLVLATGWRQQIPFLDADLRQQVQCNGAFALYRRILPPRERRLGFVGYASSSACPLTSEVAAHWLAQCFRGELALPDTAAMEQEIARVRQWTAEVFPARSEGYFIGAYIAHYADELMRDMGLPPRRGGRLREYLAPFWPRRYATLAQERRRGRAACEGRATQGR